MKYVCRNLYNENDMCIIRYNLYPTHSTHSTYLTHLAMKIEMIKMKTNIHTRICVRVYVYAHDRIIYTEKTHTNRIVKRKMQVISFFGINLYGLQQLCVWSKLMPISHL